MHVYVWLHMLQNKDQPNCALLAVKTMKTFEKKNKNKLCESFKIRINTTND